MNERINKVSRRDFIKTSAAAAVSISAFAGSSSVFAAGSDKLRVGLIGCGGRGTGAAKDCVRSSDNVEIVAMGDLFEDRLIGSYNDLKGDVGEYVNVPEDKKFVGFDAYEKVIASDIDMVILGTPPFFRPAHFEAAIEAGKHVFMEKPVAVDPVGIRKVIEAAKLAKRKKLAVVAGTQRRHQKHYIEIMKRIHDGAIGDIVGGQCYWNMGGLWVRKKEDGWSNMEWQCRNWLYFTWLSGDHITEQHVHNLDVINWAMDSTPEKAHGMGGRQVRIEPEYGNIFDHFAIDYEYPNGVHVMSMCRQTPGASSRVSERIVGTKGVAYLDGGNGFIEGANPFRAGESPNPYVQEHADLIASIRSGNPLNEGERVAESTLTAIMGRMSAYTGRELGWNWIMNKSTLDLSPEKLEMYDLPVRPVSVPGQTKLI